MGRLLEVSAHSEPQQAIRLSERFPLFSKLFSPRSSPYVEYSSSTSSTTTASSF